MEKAVTSSSLVEKIRKEIDELVVELNHTTDRNIELIEERIGRLNKLLKDADNRIVALDRRKENTTVKKTYEDIVTGRRSPADTRNTEPTVRDKVLSLAREGFDNAVIAKKCQLTLGEVDLIVSLEISKGRGME